MAGIFEKLSTWCCFLAKKEALEDDSKDVDEEITYEYDFDDESERLMKEIIMAKEIIKESKFYIRVTEDIEKQRFQKRLHSTLLQGSSNYSTVKMVIYCLGSLEFNFNSHYQLAIGLLLQEKLSWIKGIEVYDDPLFSPADIIVLKKLGCQLSTLSLKLEKPTLFYMPTNNHLMLSKLIQANWCPSQINQLILLSNCYKDSNTTHDHDDAYLVAINKYTKELAINHTYGALFARIFLTFGWHFFQVDPPHLNMKKLLPGKLSKKSRFKLTPEYEPYSYSKQLNKAEDIFSEPFTYVFGDDRHEHLYGMYRGPRKYRCQSGPPPQHWIKLNIAGKSVGVDHSCACYAGICRNEKGHEILRYNGVWENGDECAAVIQALRHGLKTLLDNTRFGNLIVEADNLKVIQWINKREHKEPEQLVEPLDRVLELIDEFNFVAYHIYEEANTAANTLAQNGLKATE